MTKTEERIIKSAKQAREMAGNAALIDLVDRLHAAQERVTELEQKLTETRCPIGLDETPTLCSAGTCYQCLGARLKASQDGET